MLDRQSSIDDFLSATAARRPTPGGGSAAALAGALAAAIGEMALNYSNTDDPKIADAIGLLGRGRSMLLELMVEDQSAYEAIAAAHKLPKDSPQRAGELAAALLIGILVPQAIGAAAAAILQSCQQVVDSANPRLVSDLAVCAELAMAALRSAMHNVRANVDEISDPQERRAVESAMNAELAAATGIIQRVMASIAKRRLAR